MKRANENWISNPLGSRKLKTKKVGSVLVDTPYFKEFKILSNPFQKVLGLGGGAGF